jgi:serine/threonine protein kinase
MPAIKAPHCEPIPGYRLLEPLGSGGFGEVWKCEAPGGLFKAIKFVYGDLNGLEGDGAQAEEELRAIERIKAIRHPFLLSMDRVECIDGELMIVTELADRNLHDVLLEYRKAGLPGIPRDELLRYLHEAAEVLDLMNQRHGLQHLDVKPRNLFLVSNHVKVADFGLVNSLGAGQEGGPKLGAITPLYAAPEVFQGKISPRSDQYSLAVAYQELLTGTLPFQAKNSRKLLLLHLQAQPDLRALSDEDSAVIGRALAKDPEKRFPSCTALLEALEGAPAGDTTQLLPQASVEFANAETVRRPSDTDPGRPRQAPPSAIPALVGYKFRESVGSTPLVDVWQARRPDGRDCLVRLVYGLGGRDAREREELILRFKALQHPALNPTEVVQSDPGRLILVSDLVGQTVRDRWQQCQGQRLSGIPRAELLDYLRATAEALDYLYQQHAIQHLALNPRSLLLAKGRVQLDEFGLAHLFWVPANQAIAPRNSRYASPELFEGQVSRTCDQYSLAVIYQELLTGAHPFRGRPLQSASGGRASAGPDLQPLPARDREAIARALAPDPLERWPSCTDLVRALQGEQPGAAPRDEGADPFVESVRNQESALASSGPGISQDTLNQILSTLIGPAGGEGGAEGEPAGPTHSGDGVRHKFRAGLPIGAAREKLDAFRRQCEGRLLRDSDETFAFEVVQPTSFWTQWIGRPPALEVQVQLSRPHAMSATPIDVTAEVRVLHCNKKRAAALLEEVGAPLLESLRTHLLVNSEKRTQDRLMWPYPVEVRCVLPDGKVTEPIECRGKDISPSGIGFYLPHEIPTAQVCINLPTAGEPPFLAVPATLVRARRCADGWYDVGALFRLATLRKARTDLRPKRNGSNGARPA